MGLRGPQAIDAATAINATRYRVRDHLLVFEATSILLKSRSSRAPARRLPARTLHKPCSRTVLP